MSNSTNSESTRETALRSSAVKPLELREPANWESQDRLAELVAVSLAPAAWSALETVLRAEMAFHLREAAFSSSAERRLEHRGAYLWIEEFLGGVVMAKYAEQAKERLHIHETSEGMPAGGSEWMDSDGTD